MTSPLRVLPSVPGAHEKPRPPRPHREAWARRLSGWNAAFRPRAVVATQHVKEYGYFFAAGASATGAGFYHSVFVGLITMAISFLAIEWRVSKSA